MVKRSIWSSILVLVTVMLTSYMAMTLTARRLIFPSEYAIYTNAILRATLGHVHEAGGFLALDYARAALVHALPSDQVASGTVLVTIPLPPHTIRQPNPTGGRGNHYISFVTDAELITYITETMPQAGWIHTDQMGASHFFTNGTQQVIVSQRYLLSTGIRELQITASP